MNIYFSNKMERWNGLTETAGHPAFVSQKNEFPRAKVFVALQDFVENFHSFPFTCFYNEIHSMVA